jgi:hypothetical protein
VFGVLDVVDLGEFVDVVDAGLADLEAGEGGFDQLSTLSSNPSRA